MELVTKFEYDDKYSVPTEEYRILETDGEDRQYKIERTLTDLGQVEKETIFLRQPNGINKASGSVC